MRMVPNLYAQHLSRYCFALPYCANRKVLDAACGTGYGTAMLGNVATRVVGVDNSTTAIDFACRYHHFFVDQALLQLDLECDIITESFDVVVSFETIEHLKNPEPFLQQVIAMEATFICSIPRDLDLPHHIRTYRFDDCKRLLDRRFSVTWYGQSETNILKDFDQETVESFVCVARQKPT